MNKQKSLYWIMTLLSVSFYNIYGTKTNAAYVKDRLKKSSTKIKTIDKYMFYHMNEGLFNQIDDRGIFTIYGDLCNILNDFLEVSYFDANNKHKNIMDQVEHFNNLLIEFANQSSITIDGSSNVDYSNLSPANQKKHDQLVTLLKNLLILCHCVSDEIDIKKNYKDNSGDTTDREYLKYKSVNFITLGGTLMDNLTLMNEPDYKPIKGELKDMSVIYLNHISKTDLNAFNCIDITEALKTDVLFEKYDSSKQYTKFSIKTQDKVLSQNTLDNLKTTLDVLKVYLTCEGKYEEVQADGTKTDKVLNLNNDFKQVLSDFIDLSIMKTKKLYGEILKQMKKTYGITAFMNMGTLKDTLILYGDNYPLLIFTETKGLDNYKHAVKAYFDNIFSNNDDPTDGANVALKKTIDGIKQTNLDTAETAIMEFLCPNDIDNKISTKEKDMDALMKDLLLKTKVLNDNTKPNPNHSPSPTQQHDGTKSDIKKLSDLSKDDEKSKDDENNSHKDINNNKNIKKDDQWSLSKKITAWTVSGGIIIVSVGGTRYYFNKKQLKQMNSENKNMDVFLAAGAA